MGQNGNGQPGLKERRIQNKIISSYWQPVLSKPCLETSFKHNCKLLGTWMETMGVEQTEFSVKDLMFVQHTFLQACLIWWYTWETVTAAPPPHTHTGCHGPLGSLLYLSRIVSSGGPHMRFWEATHWLTSPTTSGVSPLLCCSGERASSHLFHSLATRKTESGLCFLGCP